MMGSASTNPNAPAFIIKSVFQKYDKNGDGHIGAAELMELAYDLGYYMTGQQSQDVIKALDKDGSGHINFDEFLVWWKQNDKFHLFENKDKLQKVQIAVKAFRKLDKDNSGSINIHEFNIFFKETCVPGGAFSPAQESQSLSAFKQADKDGDGHIQWNEFHELLEKLGVV
eukprot:TRINITY_DN1126_c0_g1_i2.p1 TRINITY_DN1126_c0_g1~~TRINITY_DN1126_c0_g1_i2.p1  ORF type:complete len:170 (+),score=42.73 TRINITY_DN1126_c0_g1_i2:92-601(+)